MQRSHIFSLAIAWLCSGHVAAQPAGAQGPRSVIPTIYVREVMPTESRSTPGAAGRLTGEQLEEMRPYSLHDAFDFIAGVRTIDDDVVGRRAGIGVRGAPPRRSRKTLLLEDGTPINASTYLDSSGHYTPPMERLESIDVLKGAGQILHGPLNNHGVVNFRNKRATIEPRTTVEVSTGSHDTFRRHVAHQRTVNDVGIVLAYTGMDADGTFDLEDTRFDDLFGSLDWTIDANQSLAASLTYFRERSHYDESNLTPEEFAVAPRTKRGRFGQEFNTFALNYRKADVMHDWQINDAFSMSTKVFTTDVDRPRFTVVPDDSPVAALPEIEPSRPFVLGVSGRMESRNRHYRTHGAETRMQLADVGSGALEHTLQWGVRLEGHDFDDMRNRADGGAVIDEANRGALIRVETYAATAASVFVQDALQFGDWIVTPGMRAERFTQSKVREPLANDPGPHDPKEKDRNSVLLPGVSAVYEGFDDVLLFASLQRGYSPAIARTAVGFPLVPEIGINSQVGFRSTPSDRMSFEAALFYNRLEDTLVQQVFTIDGSNVTLNSGDSDAAGLDFAWRFDSSRGSAGPRNAFVEVAYNYTRAELKDGPLDGKRVPEVPLHAGSVTFGVAHGSGWALSATASHFGAFYTDVVNTRPLTLIDEDDLSPLVPGDVFSLREPIVVGRVPGHTLWSARFSYRLPGRDATVWLQGRNLSDKLYITDLENGLRPGAERTIVGGVRLQF